MIEASVFLIVFVVTFVGVGIFRRWSVDRKLLDIPNERSSHELPTPRGGGLVIVLVPLSALAFAGLFFPSVLPWQFFAGAILVSAISLVDDFRGISPLLRLCLHSAAAVLVVVATGGFEWINVPFVGASRLGRSGDILAFLWIVWMINAYNFMDGIDGIAGLQAVTAGCAWLILGLLDGMSTAVLTGGVLAAASLGFLFHNWQPARVFMGDVGSAFLGYAFAVIPLVVSKSDAGAKISGLLPPLGVIFVFFFVADSVHTFLRRLLRGEKVWLAHREHIYQRMVIAGASHRSVAALYGLLSVFVVSLVIGPRFFGKIADKYALLAAICVAGLFFLAHLPLAGYLKENTLAK